MSGRGRLWHHESVDHSAECMKCDKLFTSYSHATVHLYQTHDVRCVRCGDCCGRAVEALLTTSKSEER